MTAQRIKKLTLTEYVELEQSTDIKYEYHDGDVFALAGGTINHSVLCTNISGDLRSILKSKKKDCFALNSEMKLNIEAYDSYVYPDAMVVCGEFEQPENFEDAITNPVLIIEVLSDSTESYDRSGKFQKYQSIKTFQEYVLVSQNKPLVEIFYRKKKSNNWHISYVEGLKETFHLQSLKIDIEMTALYDRVVFKDDAKKVNK